MLMFVTALQVISTLPVLFGDGQPDSELLLIFGAYLAIEWLYFICARFFANQVGTELEIIAFLLSGIGLTTVTSVDADYAKKQFISIVLGLIVFITVLAMLKNPDFISKMRVPVAIGAIGLLALNLLLAKTINGALNWITLGPVSFQPSELVKVAFVFVGAATLEELQSTQSNTKYIFFAVACVGALFLMRDFGTALIFFTTFLVIAFMRSGDIRTIGLACAAALMGAVLILFFKPTVASRFSNYRHIWDDMYGAGLQQTRTLIYSASGGLFGLGLGCGKLRYTFAATTDLIFGIICEEWGMLVAFGVVLCFAFVAFYAFRCARNARSSYYSIAAVAAASMMLIQLSLNVFGVTDLLPWTGVTLPFISRGGTSMICSWALFALIKSADVKTYPQLEKETEDTE